MGIRVLPADVNVSGPSWSIDRSRRAIRRGLVSIKGVGPKAALNIAENRPYSSIEDLLDRTDARIVTGGKKYPAEVTGVIKKLVDANAFSTLSEEE